MMIKNEKSEQHFLGKEQNLLLKVTDTKTFRIFKSSEEVIKICMPIARFPLDYRGTGMYLNRLHNAHVHPVF